MNDDEKDIIEEFSEFEEEKISKDLAPQSLNSSMALQSNQSNEFVSPQMSHIDILQKVRDHTKERNA